MEDFCTHLKTLKHVRGMYNGLTPKHLTAMMEKLISSYGETECPDGGEKELKAIHVLMRGIVAAIELHNHGKQEASAKKRMLQQPKEEDDEIILAACTGESKPKRECPARPVFDQTLGQMLAVDFKSNPLKMWLA